MVGALVGAVLVAAGLVSGHVAFAVVGGAMLIATGARTYVGWLARRRASSSGTAER
ncbi:hypothetical protein [Micromonospora globispora]|uniref:hypothetical protein n=1 Tax=Micromonospora globispora TaxID=1450148 RepID=UPI00140400DE|nr:hypothetical protein [Micromonospora globispora]